MDARNNPFAPGAGTTPPELSGRDKVIEDVATALYRIRKGLSAKSMLLVGLRGTGKTVLLNRLMNEAEAEGLVCVQLEFPENRHLPAMLSLSLRTALLKLDRIAGIGDTVNRAFKVLGSFISSARIKFAEMEFGFELDKEVGTADTGDLDYDLSELLQSIGVAAREKQTAVVLFIDELQYVPDRELASLISALHACVQQRLPITLVGAGLPQLSGNVGKAKSYAERLFDFQEIGALPGDAATAALQRPVQAHGISFAADAVEEIMAQTDGYPYFLQEWGSTCWLVANQPIISRDDVIEATKLAISQLDSGFFRVRFDRCTPMEKNYLRAMAEIDAPAPRSGDIAMKMKKEVNQVGPLRQSLIRKGMIYSPSHGDTAFTVPLFSAYMRRTIPLPD